MKVVTMTDVRKRTGRWIVFVRIANLVLRKDIRYRFRIGRVTFFDGMLWRRIMKQEEATEEIRKSGIEAFFQPTSKTSNTFAYVRSIALSRSAAHASDQERIGVSPAPPPFAFQ